jgi:hypothetical protein
MLNILFVLNKFTMFYEGNIVITQIIFRWSSIPGRIGIWKCCRFLRREENRRTRRKTLEARERINNKLNSHMTPSTGIFTWMYLLVYSIDIYTFPGSESIFDEICKLENEIKPTFQFITRVLNVTDTVIKWTSSLSCLVKLSLPKRSLIDEMRRQKSRLQ